MTATENEEFRIKPDEMHKEQGQNLVFAEFKEATERRRTLFKWMIRFLFVNAVAFFVILFWAFFLVAYGKRDWHLLGFVALPGILFATVAIMALRAVYNVGGKQGAHEMSSMLQTIQNVSGDFSS